MPLLSASFLKHHIKDCFKINGKQKLIIPRKGEYVKFRNYERKIKSIFIIYADFESVLVPQDDGMQNPEESYTSKCQKHIACSYSYKLVCVDDKFREPFKTDLAKDIADDYVNSMIEESKYCRKVMKKRF